ncbi:enoyl-CoA hydratase-related protein [Acidisoma silvae]|uniref:Enoyl-CoA hydratase/isomerase family protein n=1 Tax=Acidisoma silvae TaxID=2802396 RepID=A0A963YU74_9PROT|nr:enoyl-CoA hydratase-related protein [Acidisoma silvae]MCB8877054.1 enoyl-CoA hydratase/isomerase family protein [Acidisoma silvae]
MSDGKVRILRHGPVGQVILDRAAKRNALDRPMLEALVAGLRNFDADPAIRAIVISGDMQAFAAGADIGNLASAGAIELYHSGFSELWDAVTLIAKPLVAAVAGYVLGGGLELAMICDIVVCDESAVFGLPETGIGIIPGAGGTQRLVRAVGKSMAMEMILAGRRLTATEALSTGIASTLTPKGEADATALGLATRIATASPTALGAAKQAVLQSFEMPLSAGIRYERSLSALMAASEDRAEGMLAFKERRKPIFKGE